MQKPNQGQEGQGQDDLKKRDGKEGETNIQKDGIDPKIVEIMKDPDAVLALLEAKRAANAEAKKYREKLEALEAERKKIEEEKLKEQGKFQELAESLKKEKEELEKRFKDMLILRALENEAIKQGIVDPEAVKLADMSLIKTDKDFQIEGVKEAIEKLKKEKPYLFEKKEGVAPPPAEKPGFRKNFPPEGENLTPEQRLARALAKK
jgi:flagellar motor protein MotB